MSFLRRLLPVLMVVLVLLHLAFLTLLFIRPDFLKGLFGASAPSTALMDLPPHLRQTFSYLAQAPRVGLVDSSSKPESWREGFSASLKALRLGRQTAAERLEDALETASFGEGLVGIEAGSQYYFGFSARALTVTQGQTLAAIQRLYGSQ